MAKPAKEDEEKKKKETVPQRRERGGPGVVVVMGMLWQPPALRVLCLCASHSKVPPRGSMCACFCLPSRSVVLLGVPVLFLFCLPSKKHRRRSEPRRKGPVVQRDTPGDDSLSLSSST